MIEPARGGGRADHPRHRHRHDPRRARDEPGDDRPQRVGRVPQDPLGRGQEGGRPLADRPVRRRVLLGVHDRRPGAGADPELPRGGGLAVGIGRDRQLHGHARRGPPAPRHRDHPPPQGRRQGLRRRLGGSRRSSGAIPASSRTRSGWARARSSTTRSRSGSSPRAR